ncbi:hypothetical protein CKM354_000278900 [Cercospora kikuchii]|uniref:Glucose-methanol-choline oxidoreductase N-terminal domain-containing protein n=1 Tax=Cercospora kikuchii TaxID=84275 RepID=A0A9P3FE37_9PEZI|nr:uncharacterized protein CKM354_000278900 [Cercospora kikuchii]GIZ39404.1 hypothetical protein CKM354_000278900 [Cercospora kikuchii]
MRSTTVLAGWLLLLSAQSTTASPLADSEAQNEHEKRQLTTFDYVIVGGGTAGLVMANRLSEDPTVSVAVIEAGSYYQVSNPLLSSTPAGDTFFERMADECSMLAANACLGGSSARNFMIYQRPTVGSLQQWADAVDDDSYTFSNWLPFFQKSVRFSPPGPTRASNATTGFDASAFNANGGPLDVSYANYAGPFSSWIEGSLNEIGVPTNDEGFNSGNLFGAQYCSSTINPSDQKRESSQTSFLDAAARRPNLRVFTLTKAKKILFENKRATGVRVTSGGFIPYTIRARKEVILSAGAFQSPQLLMVSGIGPASTLRRFNIPVIQDLAGVGQNMWDHIFFGPSYRVKVETLTRVVNDPFYLAAKFAEYEGQKTGVLTNPVCDFLGWEKTPAALKNGFSATARAELSRFSADWPEIEYLSAPGYVGEFSDLPSTQPKDGFQYASILTALVAPLSRGTVTISSSNTDDLPVIDPAWLTSRTDQEVALAAYKRNRAAFASNFMKPVLADPVEYFPGPRVQSDADILATIRSTLLTVWHAACTCKMGVASDPTAVVDNRARVFGVTGLRVVDASAAPLLPPGHPQSWIYALAEKISSHILNED